MIGCGGRSTFLHFFRLRWFYFVVCFFYYYKGVCCYRVPLLILYLATQATGLAIGSFWTGGWAVNSFCLGGGGDDLDRLY